MFVKAIASARKRIYLQTPYFLPTEALLTALQTAALAKVDVRVMMPRRSDSNMLRYASFSYIDECLQAGIKIYLYEAGMLHAKNLIIDDEIASVGSTNFDFRSFEHNFEANLFVYSQEFNQRMIDIFLSDMRRSTRIMAANWAKRKRAQRFYESVLRLLAPIL
jgi:cardiolipin synthase